MLSTLLLAKVLIPGTRPTRRTGRRRRSGAGRYLVAFTSMQRLTAHYEATHAGARTGAVHHVIAKWPSEDIGFA